jgi:hypothetical protein
MIRPYNAFPAVPWKGTFSKARQSRAAGTLTPWRLESFFMLRGAPRGM